MHRSSTLIILLLICGCGAIDAEQVPKTVETQKRMLSVESVPGQDAVELPVQNFELIAANDSNSEPPPADGDRPTFFDGIRQMIGENPAFEDGEVSSGLIESLERAEDTFKEIRQSNREAIRGMNRQLRVGNAKTTPHIVLVTIPQLRFDHLPEMSRLSGVLRSGKIFTNYYAPSDNLQAARWSLLTGQMASQIPADHSIAAARSLPEVMWQSGYETALLGGWGSRQHPVELGFDHWTGFPTVNGAVDRYPEFFFTQATKARIVKQDSAHRLTSLDLLAHEVESFLTRHAQSSRQFFLQVTLPYLNGMAEDENIKLVDGAVGHLVDTLNESGLSGKVCLIIAGETGNHSQEPQTVHGQQFTASSAGLHEGNLHTPCIVFWGLTAERGSVSDFPCSAIDLFPTLCDICMSHSGPKNFTGVSLLKAIRGEEMQVERLLYWRLADGGQAARRGRWKVILPRGEKALRLYDLETDPAETEDVSQQHPEVMQSFIAKPESNQSETEPI